VRVVRVRIEQASGAGRSGRPATTSRPDDQERRLREAVRFFAADDLRDVPVFVFARDEPAFVLLRDAPLLVFERDEPLFVLLRDELFVLPRDALFVFDRDELFVLLRDALFVLLRDALFVLLRDALFVLLRDELLVFDRDELLFVLLREPLFVFVFAREPVLLLVFLLLVFFFAALLRFVPLFERDDPEAVFVFRPDVDVFRDERRVELPPPPPPLSPSSSSSPSPSPPPSSFFATAAAAGTASPIAVPATTFFGVERPSDSCSSSGACSSSLAKVASVCHFASLNASMNFGTIRSRTISGACDATYFPAASAASSAIGRSASAAASQLVAAAEARIDWDPPLLFRLDDDAPFSSSPPEPPDLPESCERTRLTA